MAAALAGRTSNSRASPVAPSEQGSSSSAVTPPSYGCNQSSEATASLNEEKGVGESVKVSSNGLIRVD